MLSVSAMDTDGINTGAAIATSTLIGSVTTAPYTLAWNNIPAGSYSLTAQATDIRGASSTVMAIPTVALTLSKPATAAANSYTLTATPSSFTSAIVKVDFYNGATLLGTATAAPYTYTWANVPTGIHSLTAKATDTLNAITASIPVTLTSGMAQAYYIHTDHLDTPRQITDINGALVWQWDNSDPFGDNVPIENPSGLGTFEYNQRFPGQYFDKETGLHQNHFRDGYNPAIGGYTQSDPIGLAGGSFSTYTYAAENPISFVDPYGLYCLKDSTIGAIGGAAGGAFSGVVAGLQAGNPQVAIALGVLGGTFGGLAGYVGSEALSASSIGGAAAAATSTTTAKSGALGGGIGGVIAYDLQSQGMRDTQAAMVGGAAGGAIGGAVSGFLSSTAVRSALSGGLGGLSGAALSSAIVEALRAGNDCGCGK